MPRKRTRALPLFLTFLAFLALILSAGTLSTLYAQNTPVTGIPVPWNSGPSLPGTCVTTVGDAAAVFYRTGATSPGFYWCTAANTWSQGPVGSGIASLNGLSGSSQTFAVVNDTNINLAIVSSGSSHTFTMSWAGNLAIARGGTAATTALAGFTNLAPSASVAGTLIYHNGTNWTVLSGNTSGTQCLSETSGGTPSWGTCGSGSGSVTSVAQSFTGGIISVSGSPITTSGTLALTVAGTSGGIVYFSSATTWASSGALPAGNFVLGGGAGASPTATFSVIPSANGGTAVNNGTSTITIGGNFAISGAFTTTLTVTANTSVTLPTSGTLVNSAVATLSSLTSIGTIGTGTWQGTAVGATYGGTGTASPTAHAVAVAEGSSAFAFEAPGTSGNCLTSNGSSSDPTFQACPGGPGSGTTDGIAYWTSSSVLGSLNSPTTNGFCLVGYSVVAAAAVAPTCTLSGIAVVSETGASDTLLYSYRANLLNISGGSTFALTLPAATGNIASNLPFVMYNGNSAAASITPTTPNNINALTSQTALSITSKWADFIYQDSGGTINWHDLGGGIPTAAAFPDCHTGGSSALIFTASTGVIGCNTISGGGSGTLSGLTAATGANTLANGNNGAQIWNWAQTTNSQTAFTFGETTAATGTSDLELKVVTLAGSTAVPLTVVDSLSGSQTIAALSITPTWNTTGVVDAALLVNVTNTASGAASKLVDLQIGGTSEFNVDKAGNIIALGSLSIGSSPPACTAGTAGAECDTEGTAPTNVSGTIAYYADSTAHELFAATNGTNNYGMLVRVQPGKIHSTGLTTSVSTATLCAASAGACNVAGEYHIQWTMIETGTACGTPATGGVTFLLTWTDSNGTAHSAVSLGMDDASAINAVSQTFHFQTTLAAAWASGDFNISTNGAIVQYATGYTACGVGTGTYQLDVAMTRLQ